MKYGDEYCKIECVIYLYSIYTFIHTNNDDYIEMHRLKRFVRALVYGIVTMALHYCLKQQVDSKLQSIYKTCPNLFFFCIRRQNLFLLN